MKPTRATLLPNKLVFARNLSETFFGTSTSLTAPLPHTQCFHLWDVLGALPCQSDLHVPLRKTLKPVWFLSDCRGSFTATVWRTWDNILGALETSGSILWPTLRVKTLGESDLGMLAGSCFECSPPVDYSPVSGMAGFKLFFLNPHWTHKPLQSSFWWPQTGLSTFTLFNSQEFTTQLTKGLTMENLLQTAEGRYSNQRLPMWYTYTSITKPLQVTRFIFL